MHPDALEIMITTLGDQKPWLILNKFLWFEWDIPPFERSNVIQGPTVVLHGMEELFEYLSWVNYSIDGYMMHCSLFCFRRDIFIDNLQSLLTQYGDAYMDVLKKDYFWHVRIIYTPFWVTEKIIILEKDLVLLRGGNISWSFIFKVCTDYRDLYLELSRRYRVNKRTLRKMKVLYYYSVYTYVVIVYIQKYIPKKLYNFCVELWKKIVRIIKIG